MQRERKRPGRTPTSCAECRRLKLRCDRKIPCDSCVRRGCGTICPTGTLVVGKGNRLLLESTAELQNKIDTMSARIRALEEALQRSHSLTSSNTHPLLSESNAPRPSLTSQGSVQHMSSESAHITTSSSSEPETDSVIDALGTLTIGTRGETSFLSGTARTEYLIGPTSGKSQGQWATLMRDSRLPSRITKAAVLEHDVTPTDVELRQIVMEHRPPFAEAVRLCEIYLDWGETLWYPLSRHEVFEEVDSVYRANTYEEIPGPHSLALLFSILALASLFDFSQPPHNIEAFEYHILSRVALDFSSPCTTTTLQAVTVVEHNIQWLHFGDTQGDPSKIHALTGLGVRLAYRMGLHLHSARFQLEKSVVQRRGVLFWQLFFIDSLLSFYAGRPPGFSLDWVGVPYPDDEFPMRNDKGELELSWHPWIWRFGRLLHEVLVAAFGAKTPVYGTILELDHKIRDFPVPSYLQLHRVCDAQTGSQIVLQQLLLLMTKEQVILNVHRRYFSQALQDSPNDLLKHKYGPSVMAVYRSAWRLILGLASAVEWIPKIVPRLPIFWSLAFSASIAMCMIATYAPSSNLAMSALHEIDVVYGLFKKWAPHVKSASILLGHVEKVWHKSKENFYHAQSECALSKAELDRVGGGSTSVISKVNHPTPFSGYARSDSSPESYSESGDNSTHPPYTPEPSLHHFPSSIHPRIVQDMQSFDGFEVPPTATGALNYAIPEQFSHSMTDTQSSYFHLDPEVTMSQQPPTVYHSSHAQPSSHDGIYSSRDTLSDSAWKSFMAELGL